MQTVILRLSGPSGDGQLHGLAEVVGTGESQPFVDDTALLSLLHETLDHHPQTSRPQDEQM